MQRWEYYFLPVQFRDRAWSVEMNGNEPLHHGEVWSYIDNLGEKGWEMVSVVPVLAGQERLEGYGLWFKRTKRAPASEVSAPQPMRVPEPMLAAQAN